jgi:hypothetical protein
MEKLARCQWLYTLATWKAEIRKIEVQGQPRQIVHETPPPHLQNNHSKMDWRYTSSSKAPAFQV